MSFLSDLREHIDSIAYEPATTPSQAPDCEMTLTGLDLAFFGYDGLDATGPATYSDYEEPGYDTWTSGE